jgi:hypothetical protein
MTTNAAAEANPTTEPPPIEAALEELDLGDLEQQVARLDAVRRRLAYEARMANAEASVSGENAELSRRVAAISDAWQGAERAHAAALAKLRQHRRRDAAVRQIDAARAVADDHRRLAGEIAALSERLMACLRAEQALAADVIRASGGCLIDLACDHPSKLLERLAVLQRDALWASRPAPAQQQEEPQ